MKWVLKIKTGPGYQVYIAIVACHLESKQFIYGVNMDLCDSTEFASIVVFVE